MAPQGFGKDFAVLNLDFMSILMEAVEKTPSGQQFISSCVKWNNAVHQQATRPLTIFTTLYFSTREQHELDKSSPFADSIKTFGTFEKGSHDVRIDSRFQMDEQDIELQKTRWHAGTGNGLHQILRAQNIDTVVLVRYKTTFPSATSSLTKSSVGVKPLRRRDEHHISSV